MSQQPTDEVVIRRILKGDTEAYAILVARYQHMVYTLAMRILQNRELAEETAQDAFMKAYQALDRFRGGAKFSTWLYKIAYHRILDVKAKEYRYTQMESEWDGTPSHDKSAEDTWNQLMQEERRELLQQVLASLDTDDRAVLSLHYLQELSLKEVGEVMGLRPQTVKVRLFRARKRMKSVLNRSINGILLKDYGS